MSHFDDSTNPIKETNDLTPKSERSRTSSCSSRVENDREPYTKRLKFNALGYAVGENSHKCSSTLGDLARTHIPIGYKTWKKVPPHYKDLLWTAFKGSWPDMKDSLRINTMKKACDAWKKYKYELRKTLKGADPNKWRESVPEFVKTEDWDKFCENEATPEQAMLRIRNKGIKAKSGKKSTHNMGRDGYARAAYKFEIKHGHPLTPTELWWLQTHKRKDGSYVPDDKEFADNIEMLLKLAREKGKEETLQSGPIFDTFGKESRGRVRCIGSTISARDVLASSCAREMLAEVNSEHDEWQGMFDDLKGELRGEIEGVKATLEMLTKLVTELRTGKFVSGTENSQHQTSGIAAPSNTATASTSADVIPCEIRSFLGAVVAYGRKDPLGSVATVHGHTLKAREARVLIDTILIHDFPLCDGNQGGASTLSEVGQGAFIYWHDDYLPPRSHN